MLVVHRPMATKTMNWVETYNETVIVSCTFMLIAFTDYNQDKVGQGVGWVFIGLSSSIMVLTIIMVSFESLVLLAKKIRKISIEKLLKAKKNPDVKDEEKKSYQND